jgi:hypothetical protein
MKKSFVIHDESVNTLGFRMLTSGADLTEFRKNPVMLLNHNDWSLPIGRWENIRVENGEILGDPVFDMKDVQAVEVAGKVERDFIRMASVGAWPPLEVSDDPMLKLPGQTLPTVTRWVVREASIVNIGANHNAIAFYDAEGNTIDLTDAGAVLKLVDSNNLQNMKFLKQILQLADSATEAEVHTAMRTIVSDRDRLKTENVTLTSRIDELNTSAKAKQTAEALALVDAAIKDGRLNASAKESTLKLFDTDFASAKAMLEAIPTRQSITGRIDTGAGTSATELADLQKKDWNTIDKEGKLVLLKDKYVDLYKEKFKARFGCEPQV